MNKIVAFSFVLLALAANNAQAWGLGDVLGAAAQKAVVPLLQGDTDAAVNAAAGSVSNSVNTQSAQVLRGAGNNFGAGVIEELNAATQDSFQEKARAIASRKESAASTARAGAPTGGNNNAAIAQGCKVAGNSSSAKPYGTPQVDSFCQLATFDACLAAGGIHDYDAERTKVCSTIAGMGANVSMCGACR